MRAPAPRGIVLSRARLKYLRSLHQAKFRAVEGVLLLEGFNAVEEALRAGRVREIQWAPEASDTPRGRELADRAAAGTTPVPVVAIERPDVERLAQTRNPAGVFALAEDPTGPLAPDTWPANGVALIAAGVADPGNLGTLMRTAAVLGACAFATTPGSVEPGNPKAVRASAGALYRLPVARGGPTWREDLRAADVRIVVADAAGIPVREWLSALRESPATGDLAGRWALVAGNEPRGVDAETVRSADARLAVPVALATDSGLDGGPDGGPDGGLDSLNVAVAAGILLHELLAASPSAASRIATSGSDGAA